MSDRLQKPHVEQVERLTGALENVQQMVRGILVQPIHQIGATVNTIDRLIAEALGTHFHDWERVEGSDSLTRCTTCGTVSGK